VHKSASFCLSETSRRSTSSSDNIVTPRSRTGPRSMAIETLAAVAIAISVGFLVEWLSYLQLSATVRAPLALAPFGVSILTFLVFPLLRWTCQKASIDLELRGTERRIGVWGKRSQPRLAPRGATVPGGDKGLKHLDR
jgi:hypothetical protein